MARLFEDMSFDEKLNHIEECRKYGRDEIQKGSPAALADISDAFDYWMPWMLERLGSIKGAADKELASLTSDYQQVEGGWVPVGAVRHAVKDAFNKVERPQPRKDMKPE